MPFLRQFFSHRLIWLAVLVSLGIGALFARSVWTIRQDEWNYAAQTNANLVQTLEPRAFYVRTPYRDQSLFPIYDSGAADFNLSTIFNENAYVGQDRLVDNDAVVEGAVHLVACGVQLHFGRDEAPRTNPRTAHLGLYEAAFTVARQGARTDQTGHA